MQIERRAGVGTRLDEARKDVSREGRVSSSKHGWRVGLLIAERTGTHARLEQDLQRRAQLLLFLADAVLSLDLVCSSLDAK